jgi:hypothetical protein
VANERKEQDTMVDLVAFKARRELTGRDEAAGTAGRDADLVAGLGA